MANVGNTYINRCFRKMMGGYPIKVLLVVFRTRYWRIIIAILKELIKTGIISRVDTELVA